MPVDAGRMAAGADGRRHRFGAALQAERSAAGLTQSQLGELVEKSGARIGQWENASEAPPEPDLVFALERALNVPGGRLSQHLGYVPVGEATIDVIAAIDADPRLDEQARAILTSSYRAAVKTSGARS